jgi:tripartite-type tricarboxylate transporter receptor subunit TctC
VPQPIIERLRTEIANVMAQPAYGQRLLNTGSGEPYVVMPEAFVARIRNDYDKFGPIIRSIGIKLD